MLMILSQEKRSNILKFPILLLVLIVSEMQGFTPAFY